MAGLINQAQYKRFNDPTLAKLAAQIEAKVPVSGKAQCLAIENSGMQLMFSPKLNFMQKFIKFDDVLGSVPKAVGMLAANIYSQSNKKMSIPMAGPASLVLMCHILDYGEQTAGLKLTPKLIGQCTQATGGAVLKAFGIGEQQINQAVQQGKAAQAQKGAQQ
ncbi:hypothetical protein [Polynucleobacter asymbioticus]|jgi:hypothetical protein|uniref:Uncharacterized protein n=1 Tax=Polynucleobacter asymbioticus TaxID=576611 RepID=A0AAC9IXP8_9BURK|nr:hypothetical protein [Polynucleobacter asymbioticus]APB99011.1 hypothetical protein A4F89_06565 [Polynucleobacter asymbioticus]APC01313.1 hypothetical protein AOC25_06665 [Polynucleobacter asymbioticus]